MRERKTEKEHEGQEVKGKNKRVSTTTKSKRMKTLHQKTREIVPEVLTVQPVPQLTRKTVVSNSTSIPMIYSRDDFHDTFRCPFLRPTPSLVDVWYYI